MRSLRTQFVVHGAIEIRRPAAVIWDTILSDVAACHYYSRSGYRVDPIDAPSAWLGGNHVRLESPLNDAAPIFDRDEDFFALVTERDDENRRLSMRSTYPSPKAGGLVTYSTYQAVPKDDFSLYYLDCHLDINVPVDLQSSAVETKDRISNMWREFQDETDAYLEEVRLRLETGESSRD